MCLGGSFCSCTERHRVLEDGDLYIPLVFRSSDAEFTRDDLQRNRTLVRMDEAEVRGRAAGAETLTRETDVPNQSHQNTRADIPCVYIRGLYFRDAQERNPPSPAGPANDLTQQRQDRPGPRRSGVRLGGHFQAAADNQAWRMVQTAAQRDTESLEANAETESNSEPTPPSSDDVAACPPEKPAPPLPAPGPWHNCDQWYLHCQLQEQQRKERWARHVAENAERVPGQSAPCWFSNYFHYVKAREDVTLQIGSVLPDGLRFRAWLLGPSLGFVGVCHPRDEDITAADLAKRHRAEDEEEVPFQSKPIKMKKFFKLVPIEGVVTPPIASILPDGLRFRTWLPGWGPSRVAVPPVAGPSNAGPSNGGPSNGVLPSADLQHRYDESKLPRWLWSPTSPGYRPRGEGKVAAALKIADECLRAMDRDRLRRQAINTAGWTQTTLPAYGVGLMQQPPRPDPNSSSNTLLPQQLQPLQPIRQPLPAPPEKHDHSEKNRNPEEQRRPHEVPIAQRMERNTTRVGGSNQPTQEDSPSVLDQPASAAAPVPQDTLDSSYVVVQAENSAVTPQAQNGSSHQATLDSVRDEERAAVQRIHQHEFEERHRIRSLNTIAQLAATPVAEMLNMLAAGGRVVRNSAGKSRKSTKAADPSLWDRRGG